MMSWTETIGPDYDRRDLLCASDLRDAEWAVIAPLMPEPDRISKWHGFLLFSSHSMKGRTMRPMSDLFTVLVSIPQVLANPRRKQYGPSAGEHLTPLAAMVFNDRVDRMVLHEMTK